MKNVKINVRLNSLIKSFAVLFFIIIIFIAGSAFTSNNDIGKTKKPITNDQWVNDKSGFKSLFPASPFDPTKPYIAQLNPRAVPFVQNYILQEGANLEKMKIWGKPYFDIYDHILRQYNLPVELKYLSVIESSLVANSVSIAGAVGPWQIMADEAKRLGLTIDKTKDERTNVYKSTQVAAKILRGLHKQFKDWLLVIAAYNCGEGRVRQAIRKSGTNNFWDLQAYLPAETRSHVKRFIGTHFIFEGNGGLTTMTAAEVLNFDNTALISKENITKAEEKGYEIVQISGKYKSAVIAKNLGIELAVFNSLNPNFDKSIASGQIYNMRIPQEKVEVFKNNRNTILNESIVSLLNT